MINFIPSEKLARVDSVLQSGADAFTRSMLLKRLLHEAEKPCLTRQQFGHKRERPPRQDLGS